MTGGQIPKRKKLGMFGGGGGRVSEEGEKKSWESNNGTRKKKTERPRNLRTKK